MRQRHMNNDNVTDQSTSLSSLRMMIFPIFPKELPKFLPMAGLIFFTIFSFTMLRNMKDVLMLSAPGVKAASLPYIKFCIVFPTSIVFSLIYIKLKNYLEFEKAYYAIMGFFISFFIVFNYLLYPNAELIHPSAESIAALQNQIPVLSNFVGLLGVWSFTMYYVISELWGTYSLSVLFWQFANDNVSTEESKRFYPLFILVGNIALLILSFILDYISKNYTSSAAVDPVNNTVIFAGICMLVLFRYTNQYILSDPQYQPTSKKVKKKKAKLSMYDSLVQLSQSRYVLYIAVLVLSYGIMINIFETVWKEQVRVFFTVDGVVDKSAMLGFMSKYTFYTGVFTIVLNFLSKDTVRLFGWLAGAVFTPIICTGASLIFLIYSINASIFQPSLAALGLGAWFAVYFGMGGVILTKSSKYAFFDPTKEMSFIPISSDLRTSGKAAVDGVGARLGKSGGGLIQIAVGTIITMFTGSPVDALQIAPYMLIVLAIMGFAWLTSAFNLNVLYQKAVAEEATSNG